MAICFALRLLRRRAPARLAHVVDVGAHGLRPSLRSPSRPDVGGIWSTVFRTFETVSVSSRLRQTFVRVCRRIRGAKSRERSLAGSIVRRYIRNRDSHPALPAEGRMRLASRRCEMSAAIVNPGYRTPASLRADRGRRPRGSRGVCDSPARPGRVHRHSPRSRSCCGRSSRCSVRGRRPPPTPMAPSARPSSTSRSARATRSGRSPRRSHPTADPRVVDRRDRPAQRPRRRGRRARAAPRAADRPADVTRAPGRLSARR